MEAKGFFITLEGIDGCGKTTQASLLAQHLREKGREVVHTREPGGTAIGSRIRAILLDPGSADITADTELLLYSADRAQHVAELIEPALSRGAVVLCDRFTDATAAYQGFARGLDMETIQALNELSTRGCRPDLTLVFDLPVEVALSRARGRNDENGSSHEARFEQEEAAFHEKVRQGYLGIASCDPGRVKGIDASGAPEAVQAAVRAAVDAAL